MKPEAGIAATFSSVYATRQLGAAGPFIGQELSSRWNLTLPDSARVGFGQLGRFQLQVFAKSPLEDIFQIMIVVDVETAHRRWFPRMLQLSPCVPVQHPFAAGRSRCRNRRYGAVAAGYRTSGPRFSVERRQGDCHLYI